MAEIGLVGTIVGLATTGVKLSLTLYTFSETVSAADNDIKNIARDVSLTSAVLEELGANLRQDEQAKLYSNKALQTAGEVVEECEAVFKDLDDVMRKTMVERVSKKGIRTGKSPLSFLDKLKWPFMQPKVELLRTNLERLKSTLLLMLNVLTYARDLRAGRNQPSNDDVGYQKILIENLIRANQEATSNYKSLLRTISHNSASDQSQSRDLGSEDSTVHGILNLSAMNVSDALSLDQTKHNQNPGITASSIPDAESKAESTIRVCLDRIEQALRKIEQETAPENGSLRVGIELEKKIGKTEPDGPVRPSPWAVLAIAPSVIARESGSKPFQKAVRETSASYQEPEEVVANHEAVEEEVVIIKCICACADDDGHTVFCEKCETWQHVACYFPDGRIPDEHYCTDCSPHTIDTEAGSERHQHGSKAGESHSAVKAYTSWGSSQRSTEDWVRWNSSTGRQSAAQPQEGFQKDTNNSKYYYKALEAYEAYEEQLKEMEALHWKRMGRPEGWTPDMHGPNKELEIFKKFGNEDKASREHMKYIAPRMHRMTDEQHEWKEQHASPPPPRSFEPDFGGRSSKARKATVRLSTYSPPEHRREKRRAVPHTEQEPLTSGTDSPPRIRPSPVVPATGSPPPRHLHAPESDADREPRRGRHDREYDSEEIVPGPSRPDRLGRLSSSQRDRRDRSSSSDWYEACRSTSNAGVNTIACMFSPSEEDMSSAVKDDAGVDQLLKEWTTLYDEPPDVVESDAM